MWELADGSIAFGPMTYGPPFGPTGGTVTINWTAPAPDAVLVGMLHTHPINFPYPSGSNYSSDDQYQLSYITAQRTAALQNPATQARANPDLARIYIGWNEGYNQTTPGPTKINVYNKYNRDAAIGGTLGPEVDPDGVACPPPN